MNITSESRLGYFLVAIGLGVIGAALSVLLARKESREYLFEQGAKSLGYLSTGGKILRESAGGIAQKGRQLMSQRCSRCGILVDVTMGNGNRTNHTEP
jgi:hypothetical protein